MKVVGNGLGKLRDSFGFILAAPKQIMGTYNMMPWRLSKSSAIAATARLNQQGLADNVSVEKMNQIQRGINARNAYLSMQAAKVGPTDASFIPGYVPASYVKSSEVTKVADLTTAPKMSAPGQPVISKEYSITSPFMPDPRTVFELEKVALVTAKVGDNAEVAVKKASLFQRAFGKNTMSMEKFGNACSMTQGMLSGIATGIIMMATSTDPWIKGIGAMVVALSTFAAVLTFVRTLLDPKSWFGGPIGAIALATLATAATVGAVYAMTSAPSGNGLNTQAYEKAPSGTVFASATATDAAASSNSTVVYNQWFPTAVQSPLTVAANR